MKVINIDKNSNQSYTTYETPESIGLQDIIINTVWKLVPHTCYMNLVDADYTIEDATSYKLESSINLESKQYAVCWINDLLDRWSSFNKIKTIMSNDQTNQEKLDEVNQVIQQHDVKLQAFRS